MNQHESCVNLFATFGDQFRIRYDEAYDPTNRPQPDRDPWMMELPCALGTIYPYADKQQLAVEVDRHPSTCQRLIATGCCRLIQDGDREKTFVFDLGDFPVVAKIVKPRRRRQLSDENRRKAVERLAKFRFQARTSDGKTEAETRSGVRV